MTDSNNSNGQQDNVSRGSGCREDIIFCRICHDSGGNEALFRACRCAGTMAHIHQSCLCEWLRLANIRECELCHTPFSMSVRRRRITRWTCSHTNCVTSPILHYFAGILLIFVSMCLCVFALMRIAHDGSETPWFYFLYLFIAMLAFIIGSLLCSSIRDTAWNTWVNWINTNMDIIVEPYVEPRPEESTSETNL